MAQEGEESLGQAFQRQVDRFQEMQKTTQDMANDFTRLKTQCDTLKSQRQTLTTECTTLQTDRQTLRADLENLQNERDSLRLELAKEHDQNTWWENRDLQASGTASMEFDSVGKLKRKIWHLETRNKELESIIADGQAEKVREVEEVKMRLDKEVVKERAVSAGLRDRIGSLEEKIRQKDNGSSEELERIRSVYNGLESELKDTRQRITELEGQQQDLKEALGKEKRQTRTLEGDVSRLTEEKRDILEELSSLKLKGTEPTTPRKALADKHLNIQADGSLYLPTTPTKPLKLLSPTSNRPSPRTHAALPVSQARSPTASLAKRYTNLEASHAMLRADYTKLREEYGRDLLRWKEFKAVESERSEARKRKREEKRRVRGLSVMEGPKDSSGTTVTGVGIEVDGTTDGKLVSASDESYPLTSQAVGRESWPSKRRKQPEELVETDFEEEMAEMVSERPRKEPRVSSSQRHRSSQRDIPGEDPFRARRDLQQPSEHRTRSPSKPRRSATPVSGSPPDKPAQHKRPSASATPEPTVNVDVQTSTSNATPHYTRSRIVPAQIPAEPRTPATMVIRQRATTTTPLTRQPSIPYLDSDGKKRAVLPSRQTPWLGRSEVPQSTSKLSNHHLPASAVERDSFGDDDLPPLPSVMVTPKTPLVRDRTGSTTSLRRTALTKSVSIHHGEDHETPSSRGDAKKKGDIETMTPRDKALELRRLGKMGASEKREYYAEYKGKGRYLPAEEMRAQVLDEYEIDPEQNEGMRHQFHDVKRKKEERKHMCGGDCEECQGYYDAIGELPKYNTGPRWNDESKGDTSREEDVQAHQNKVSRHRETWRKPPTPPGYWNIGFPSTQAVDEQNAKADAMVAEREAQIRREAAHKDSKWRKKA